jgi:hypothetical protein
MRRRSRLISSDIRVSPVRLDPIMAMRKRNARTLEGLVQNFGDGSSGFRVPPMNNSHLVQTIREDCRPPLELYAA